jgi:hypothetical protein
MIVAIVTNAQGQAQISFEGGQPWQVRDLLDIFADQIDEQMPPEHKRKSKSGLIVPQTAIPKNIVKPNGAQG